MKRMFEKLRVMTIFLMVLALLTPNISYSQKDILEEIIVTAERRTQNLQEVASSVGVIDGVKIERLGLDDFLSYSRSQPGIVLHQPVKNRATWNVRGINTDIGDTQLTQEPVAVYINDMAVSQPNASLVQVDLRMYDIERIELLRGPQGTLFGSGTLGGLVRVLTKQPQLGEFEGSVRADFADVSQAGLRQRYDAMLNMPLAENVAVRAVASVRDEQGWVKNPTLGTENASDDWNARASLLWQINEKMALKLEAIHQDSEPEDGDAWNPDIGRFKRDTIITEERKTVFTQYNVTLNYDFEDFANLTSSSNLQRTKSNWLLQSGEIPGIGKLLNLSEPYDNEYISQEFRLVSNTDGPFDWVAGVFYSEVKTLDSNFKFVLDGLQEFAEVVVGPGIINSDTIFDAPQSSSSTELAAYGDVSYQLNQEWSVTGGLRVFEFETMGENLGGTAFDFDSFSYINLTGFSNFAKDNDFTWRTVLSFQPDEDSHYYANISRGYRVGQTNPNFGPSLVDPNDVVISEAYAADESINYEFGLKKSLLGDRLQVNAAAYFIDWSDIQVDALRPSDERNFIANAGDAESKGIELELIYLASDQLDMRFTVTLQDAEINSISPQNSFLSGARVGDRLPGTPDYMFSGEFNYSWMLQNSFLVTAYANAQFVGSSTNRFSGQAATGLANPDFAINDSYENFDVGVMFERDNWAVTLYSENLTDNDDIILDTGAVATASGENHYITLRPRTIGMRMDYRF